jgi:hypothetical protein
VLGVLVLAMITSAIGATAAGAATSCPGTVEYPFLAWGDSNSYVLAPSGDFESKSFGTRSGWALTGGSKAVAGNEPFFAHSKRDSRSLLLPAGGTATTPTICVSLYDPTIRLFAVGGNATSALLIEVIAPTPFGPVTTPVAKIDASKEWSPTAEIYFGANLLSALSADGTTSVQFRFTSLGSASWKIDDLYIDPRKGG